MPNPTFRTVADASEWFVRQWKALNGETPLEEQLHVWLNNYVVIRQDIGQPLAAVADDAPETDDAESRVEVQTMNAHHWTTIGPAIYVRVRSRSMHPLLWPEVNAAIHDIYPDMWGVQSFPPASHVVDDANMYHVLLFPVIPKGFDIFAEWHHG